MITERHTPLSSRAGAKRGWGEDAEEEFAGPSFPAPSKPAASREAALPPLGKSAEAQGGHLVAPLGSRSSRSSAARRAWTAPWVPSPVPHTHRHAGGGRGGGRRGRNGERRGRRREGVAHSEALAAPIARFSCGRRLPGCRRRSCCWVAREGHLLARGAQGRGGAGRGGEAGPTQVGRGVRGGGSAPARVM